MGWSHYSVSWNTKFYVIYSLLYQFYFVFPILFFVHRFTIFEQRYTTVAFIYTVIDKHRLLSDRCLRSSIRSQVFEFDLPFMTSLYHSYVHSVTTKCSKKFEQLFSLYCWFSNKGQTGSSENMTNEKEQR